LSFDQLDPTSERLQRIVDIEIDDGKIKKIHDKAFPVTGKSQFDSKTVIDCAGMCVSPPFVESHIHLDSALVDAGQCQNRSGTLFEGIENWRKIKEHRSESEISAMAREALALMMKHGTLYVRSHADVSDPKQRPLNALAALRDAMKDEVHLQIVAFPQDGLLRHKSQIEWVEDAIRTGKADVVGGIPHYELSRELGTASVTRVVELAMKYQRMIDLHCDEIDDPQSRFLECVVAEILVAEKNWSIEQSTGATTKPPLVGKMITASHTTAMGSYENGYFNKLLSRLMESKVNFVANPLINIVLQGRSDSYPKRRGLTRVKELWQAGCNVSLGNDCIMDPWYALGTGNMLDAAYMAVHVCQMIGRDEINACYDMITWNGADTLGVSGYGVEVGNEANLIVLPVTSKFEAIRNRVAPKVVIRRGKVI
jgi:cytosine/creatinine deaminase